MSGQLVSFFPNPARNIVYLALHPGLQAEGFKINLTDLAGRIVREVQLKSGRELHEMSLNGILPGFYVISIVGSQRVISGSIYIY